jgi:hypothetical protein
MSTPEQIQHNIEGTRAALSADVDRLSEKVSPGRIVGRRVERVRSGAGSLRERVMGAMPDGDQLSSAGSAAGDAVSNAAGTVRQAAADAPHNARRQTQGNPLAAGLVAFGVGMVLASLAPATDAERELAGQAEQKAVGPLQETAKEVAAQLQEPAKEAAQQIKEAATHAASETADQARSSIGDVAAH